MHQENPLYHECDMSNTTSANQAADNVMPKHWLLTKLQGKSENLENPLINARFHIQNIIITTGGFEWFILIEMSLMLQILCNNHLRVYMTRKDWCTNHPPTWCEQNKSGQTISWLSFIWIAMLRIYGYIWVSVILFMLSMILSIECIETYTKGSQNNKSHPSLPVKLYRVQKINKIQLHQATKKETVVKTGTLLSN